jgi:hypothetical protein
LEHYQSMKSAAGAGSGAAMKAVPVPDGIGERGQAGFASFLTRGDVPRYP